MKTLIQRPIMSDNNNKISGKKAAEMLRKFSYTYPQIRCSIQPNEIVKLINKIEFCQISGKVFPNFEGRLYIVPVNPFEESC